MKKELTPLEYKLQRKAMEAFFAEHDSVSDIEDLSVEWDGCYGKHWQSFSTREEMRMALAQYDLKVEMFCAEFIAIETERREAQRRLTTNSLADFMSPEVLNKLKSI